MSFPDREALFRLGFRELVDRLDALRITDLALVDPAERGDHYDWLLLVERFPERLVKACHELTEDELRHSFELADSIFHGAETYGGRPREDILHARFNLSAVLLRTIPARPGLAYLDPAGLLRDYLAALPMTLAEAQQMELRRDTLDTAEFLRLREPKLLMMPLKLVDHLFEESADLDEYRKWKELWPDLA
ncbi:hypothetical protein JOF56_005867 [Kibdelosporangium banguiense]|uniref:Uncharacterized protein n=1 Tax=Kibdelosporangium banguiense TaxID=1365924 RepID=A0ABS4TM50_9PSEU|nr:hypothetical protein [Kibdelosporangium banguiense]MBP2325482.1 hypothetical protein [Kibdelosporangium banguiense]